MLYVAGYQGKDWWSRAIRWQTWSKWSHVALVWREPDQPFAICPMVEAWPGGVRRQPTPYEGHAPGTVVDFFSVVGLSAKQADDAWKWALGTVGERYDYWSVIRFVPRWLMPAAGRDAWFCAEHVFTALGRVEWPVLLRTDPAEVSPGMIIRSPMLHYCESGVCDNSGEAEPWTDFTMKWNAA